MASRDNPIMKLWEYDLRLYGVLKACFREGLVSPLRDQPNEEMWAGLQRSFKTLQVGKTHACGDRTCRSFYTTRAEPPNADVFHVRFEVCGELTLSCDAEGTIYYVEWLPGDASKADTMTRYVLTKKGYEARPMLRR